MLLLIEAENSVFWLHRHLCVVVLDYANFVKATRMKHRSVVPCLCRRLHDGGSVNTRMVLNDVLLNG